VTLSIDGKHIGPNVVFVSPGDNLIRRGHDGYKQMAINFPKFFDINQMPIKLDLQRLDEGSGI